MFEENSAVFCIMLPKVLNVEILKDYPTQAVAVITSRLSVRQLPKAGHFTFGSLKHHRERYLTSDEDGLDPLSLPSLQVPPVPVAFDPNTDAPIEFRVVTEIVVKV